MMMTDIVKAQIRNAKNEDEANVAKAALKQLIVLQRVLTQFCVKAESCKEDLKKIEDVKLRTVFTSQYIASNLQRILASQIQLNALTNIELNTRQFKDLVKVVDMQKNEVLILQEEIWGL